MLGGHTKGASYRSFLRNAQKIGVREASLIARLEWSNIVATHAFARKHGIDCDSHPCRTVDVIYAQDQWKSAVKAAEYMKAIFGDGGSAEIGVDSYTVHGPRGNRKAVSLPRGFWLLGV